MEVKEYCEDQNLAKPTEKYNFIIGSFLVPLPVGMVGKSIPSYEEPVYPSYRSSPVRIVFAQPIRHTKFIQLRINVGATS